MTRYRLFGLFCLAVFFSLGFLVACGGAPTPVPPTPTPPPEEEAPGVGHALGRAFGACLTCHETGAAGAPQVPADHAGRTNDTCLDCHEAPPEVLHSLEGRDECLVCHETGVEEAPQVPANHAGRTNDLCLSCHRWE